MEFVRLSPEDGDVFLNFYQATWFHVP